MRSYRGDKGEVLTYFLHHWCPTKICGIRETTYRDVWRIWVSQHFRNMFFPVVTPATGPQNYYVCPGTQYLLVSSWTSALSSCLGTENDSGVSDICSFTSSHLRSSVWKRYSLQTWAHRTAPKREKPWGKLTTSSRLAWRARPHQLSSWDCFLCLGWSREERHTGRDTAREQTASVFRLNSNWRLNLPNLVFRWSAVLSLFLHLQVGHLHLPDLIHPVCHPVESWADGETKMMCQTVSASHFRDSDLTANMQTQRSESLWCGSCLFERRTKTGSKAKRQEVTSSLMCPG